MLEGHSFELKCFKNFNMSYEVSIMTYGSEKLFNLHRRIQDRFNVLDQELSRLWKMTFNEEFVLLDLDSSVKDAGLKKNQVLVLQTQHGGKWCGKEKAIKKEVTPKYSNNISDEMQCSSEISSPLKKCSIACDGSSQKEKKGLCGLANLGNTCYMNSVIQCLSNCPPLTEYFLENKHLSELNTANALGMRGEIAKAYSDLLHVIWSGKFPNVKPFHFKATVSRFNSQFSGFSQHDAQELLTFLLDGLHEDLSRVNKAVIEQQECADQTSLKSPKEPWIEYTKRSNSIVVDTFHGLLKSRVICPQCEQLSVTFDPFCMLSVPLPMKKDRYLKVYFVPKDPSEKVSSLKIPVSQKLLVRDLCKEVSVKTNSDPDMLISAEVNTLHFHKFYTQDDNLELIQKDEVIYVYEMPEEANDEHYVVLPVCFWDLSKPNISLSLKHGFGIPLLLVFSKSELRQRRLGFGILSHINKRFKLPLTFPGEKNNYMPNIYLLDTGHTRKSEPYKLQFDERGESIDDIIELLDIDKAKRDSGRKTLIVDLSLCGKEEYLAGLSLEKERNYSRKYLESSSDLQIYDCINLFASCEKLGADNAWYCPRCKRHQRATKKFDIWTLPEILVVHFKRFSYSRFGSKIDTHVEFPIKDLNLYSYVINPGHQNVTYDLIGVVNHYGSMLGGHYTAYCRNKFTESWYCYNDSSVSQVDETQVVSPSAYVLFYKKKYLDASTESHIGHGKA